MYFVQMAHYHNPPDNIKQAWLNKQDGFWIILITIYLKGWQSVEVGSVVFVLSVNSWPQQSEWKKRDFRNRGVVLSHMHLSGTIDQILSSYNYLNASIDEQVRAERVVC